MTPRDTTYRLATTADLRRCHALMREQGEPSTLSWLTVVAERDGKLLGFLSSKLKTMVVAARNGSAFLTAPPVPSGVCSTA